MPDPKKRRRKRQPVKPELTLDQILVWADHHKEKTGKFPTVESGKVLNHKEETWRNIDNALRYGLRGLRPGSSLAKLFKETRGHRSPGHLPPLTEDQILQWANDHKRRTGSYPNENSGDIPDTNGENWNNVNAALFHGHRGLTDGTSLAKLFADRLGAKNYTTVTSLTVEKILAWADVHLQATGSFPKFNSGEVVGVPGETWSAIDTALRVGVRGLPGKSSLPQLLALYRGVRNKSNLPKLTKKRILAWAKAHFEKTGKWPNENSGKIAEAPGETWKAVSMALIQGLRGLPGGTTLRQLLNNSVETTRSREAEQIGETNRIFRSS
jgi:hypothetical protein